MDDADETLVAAVMSELAELHMLPLLTLLLKLGEAVPRLALGEGEACTEPLSDIVRVFKRGLRVPKQTQKRQT